MPRCRSLLILLLLAAPLLSPAPAAAVAFTPQWTLAGWTYLQELGNTDSDPQHELMFASKADNHLAIVDGSTGAIEKEFPQFTSSNTLSATEDVDGDGRPEFFFSRLAEGPVTPFTAAYHWNGLTYVTLFTHTDPVASLDIVKVRSATTYDVSELSDTDVRLRNLVGTVLFRASTAIAGWSGTGASVSFTDIDGDGIDELGAVENWFTPTSKVHFYDYAGGFVPAWTVTGWNVMGAVHTDGDAQPEILMTGGTDLHYGLFDGLSGALEQEFPGFKASDNVSFQHYDTDGDGISEIFLLRPDGVSLPRVFTAYKWVGGTYTTMFSHTDPVTDFYPNHIRSSSQLDIVESNIFPGEVRVRNLAGSVLYRASTAIPGWSGLTAAVSEVDSNHDGVVELAIRDGGTLRFVRYTGTFVQPWSTTAWTLPVEIDGVDGDPQSELVVESTADQHYALLDTPTGAVEQQFPAFGTNDSFLQPMDLDNDGRLELFFGRVFPLPQFYAAYDWTPSGYVTMFSHNDEMNGPGSAHFRNPGLTEIVEPGVNDLRLRDSHGVVIFRASTDLPGWTGANRDVRILDVDGDGVSELLAIDDGAVRLLHATGLTAVGNGGDGRAFVLLSSAPNPFRTGAAIRFVTPEAGYVSIRVFDAGGRLLRRLDDRVAAGPHEVRWDGKDEQGRAAPSGILFYEVVANGTRRTGRMVRLGS